MVHSFEIVEHVLSKGMTPGADSAVLGATTAIEPKGASGRMRQLNWASLAMIFSAGSLAYGILYVKVDYDLLAVLGVLVALVLAVRDRQWMIFGWLALAPYFLAVDKEGSFKIAANVTHFLYIPAMFLLTLLGGSGTRKIFDFRRDGLFYGFLVFLVFSMQFMGQSGYDPLRSIVLVYIWPFLLYLVVLQTKIDNVFFRRLTILTAFHIVVLSFVVWVEAHTGRSLFVEALGLNWQDTGNLSEGRVAGPFVSPIILGLFCMFAFCIQIIAFVSRRTTFFFFIVMTVLTSGIIFYTLTRSVWLGMIATVVFFVWKYRARRIHKVLLLGAILGACAILLFVFLSNPDLRSRLLADTVSIRLIIAYASILMFIANPLFGVGFGTFNDKVGGYIINLFAIPAQGFNTSHVTLLTFLAELGLVGTFFIVGFIVKSIAQHKLKGVRDLRRRAILTGLYAFLLSFFINAFLIDMRFFTMGYSLFFLALAMIVVVKEAGTTS